MILLPAIALLLLARYIWRHRHKRIAYVAHKAWPGTGL